MIPIRTCLCHLSEVQLGANWRVRGTEARVFTRDPTAGELWIGEMMDERLLLPTDPCLIMSITAPFSIRRNVRYN